MFNLQDTPNIKGYSALQEDAAKVFESFLKILYYHGEPKSEK